MGSRGMGSEEREEKMDPLVKPEDDGSGAGS